MKPIMTIFEVVLREATYKISIHSGWVIGWYNKINPLINPVNTRRTCSDKPVITKSDIVFRKATYQISYS